MPLKGVRNSWLILAKNLLLLRLARSACICVSRKWAFSACDFFSALACLRFCSQVAAAAPSSKASSTKLSAASTRFCDCTCAFCCSSRPAAVLWASLTKRSSGATNISDSRSSARRPSVSVRVAAPMFSACWLSASIWSSRRAWPASVSSAAELGDWRASSVRERSKAARSTRAWGSALSRSESCRSKPWRKRKNSRSSASLGAVASSARVASCAFRLCWCCHCKPSCTRPVSAIAPASARTQTMKDGDLLLLTMFAPDKNGLGGATGLRLWARASGPTYQYPRRCPAGRF